MLWTSTAKSFTSSRRFSAFFCHSCGFNMFSKRSFFSTLKRHRQSGYFAGHSGDDATHKDNTGIFSVVQNFGWSEEASERSIRHIKNLKHFLTPNIRLQKGAGMLKSNRFFHWRTTAAVFHEVMKLIPEATEISEFNADVLFRSCGSTMPAAVPAQRLRYLNILWKEMPRLGVEHDVKAYARLQQCFLQNRYPFSAADFVARVRRKGFEPNDFIYLGSIMRCAQDNDPKIDEISQYMEALISSSETSPQVLRKARSALVSAHAKLKNENEVKRLLDEAKSDTTIDRDKRGVTALGQCYFSMANVEAEKGDARTLFQVIELARREGACLTDYQFLYLANLLTSVNRSDSVLRLLTYMPKSKDWIYRTLPFVLQLIACGHYVTALTVLQRSAAAAASANVQPNYGTVADQQSHKDDGFEMLPNEHNVYNFLQDLFYMKLPVTQIAAFCRRLTDCGYAEDAFSLAAVVAFDRKHNEVARTLLEHGSRIRPASSSSNKSNLRQPHFWPAVRLRSALGDLDGVTSLLVTMRQEHTYPGIGTLGLYVFPHFQNISLIDTIYGFAFVGSLQSRLTAYIVACLRRGNASGATEALRHFFAIPLQMTSLGAHIQYYYKRTYDARLIVDILTRQRALMKSCGTEDDCQVVVAEFISRLRTHVSTEELSAITETLSNAGFTVRTSSSESKD